MLRKTIITTLALLLSISLITDGYSNGRDRNKSKQSAQVKKVKTVNVVSTKQATVKKTVLAKQVRVTSRPPASRVAVIPVRPTPRSVWIPGYWTWNYLLSEWVWISGYWDFHPLSGIWIPGYWQELSGVWIWIEGRWRL